MKRVCAIAAALMAAATFFACHAISREGRAGVAEGITLAEVRENPETYTGGRFLWGGFIVNSRPSEDSGTEIEVVENPLTSLGAIRDTDISRGRFLVLVDSGLDPLIYAPGRLITVAGELLGVRRAVREDGRPYAYPLIRATELHLFRIPPLPPHPLPATLLGDPSPLRMEPPGPPPARRSD